jgi:hypothetical protein
MALVNAKNMAGRIIVVQENRFRLVGDNGRSYLFALHHAGDPQIEDLQRWQQDGTRLMVEYTGEPNIATGVAHSVSPTAVRPA